MSTKRGLIIALDGVASSGKSTTAKLVAQRLGYMHIDTGAMYRAVALKMLRCGVELTDNTTIDELLRTTEVSQRSVESQVRILLDGVDVTRRDPDAGDFAVGRAGLRASAGARAPGPLAAGTGASGGVVLEGRDIGTVVFPDADLKMYMTADLRTRAPAAPQGNAGARHRSDRRAKWKRRSRPATSAIRAASTARCARRPTPIELDTTRHDHRRPGGPDRGTGAQAA